MSRVIVGRIKWARVVPAPVGLEAKRPRGVRGLGVRYEKHLAKALPFARRGVWFKWEDRSGTHVCQADLVYGYAGIAWILEAKLKETEEGWEQLEKLYLPIAEAVWMKPARGIQVAKHLRGLHLHERHSYSVNYALAEAMQQVIDKPNSRQLWQWLDKGPVGCQLPGSFIVSGALAAPVCYASA